MDKKYLLDILNLLVKNEPRELKPPHPDSIPILAFAISAKDATICIMLRHYL